MRIRRGSYLAALAGAFVVVSSAGAALAYDRTCEDEMPCIAELIAGIPNEADENLAEHQYHNAQ